MKAAKLLVFVVVLLCLYAGPAWAQVEQVSKTGPDIVLTDQDFSYNITLNNTGTAATAQVVDTLPAGVDLNGPLPQGCRQNEVANVIMVTCTVTVGPDSTASLTLNVEAPDTVPASGEISNQATVTGGGPTSNQVVTQVADLDFRKTGSPRTVEVGEEVTYTITVDNDGANDIDGLVIEDLLRGADVVVIDADSDRSDDDCTIVSNDEVECELDTLEGEGPGAEDDVAVITIVVEALETGTIRNTATLSEGDVEIAQREVRTRVEDDDNNNGNNNNGNNNDNNNNEQYEDFFDRFFGDGDGDFDDFFDEQYDEDELDEEDEDDIFGDDGDADDGVTAEADEDGAESRAGDTAAEAQDPDELEPVDEPRGDVVDEIDTRGTPLPPTGGTPVGRLVSLAGISLAPLIVIALVATGLSARWVRRRRER